MMSAEKNSKIHANTNDNTGPSAITAEDEEIRDSVSVQNAEKSSNVNKGNTDSNTPSSIDSTKTLTPLNDTIKNLSKLLGIAPPTNLNANGVAAQDDSTKNMRQRPESGNTSTNSDSTNKGNKSSAKGKSDKNNDNKSDSSTASGGLNLKNLNNAAKKFSTDPVVAIKEKAMELGRKMGLENGNLEGQGKISNSENKAKLEAILATTGTPHPLPNSTETQTTTSNSDDTATAISDTNAAPMSASVDNSTPSPAPTQSTAPTTASNTPVTTDTASTSASGNTTKDNKKEKEAEDGPPLTLAQAAEHYSKEFKIGYNQGFNDGYTEGAIVTYHENSAETKAAKLQDTEAYRDGVKAGEASMTAAGAATDALVKSYKDKYCQPYKDAKNTPQGPTKEQEDNNIAYNQGFNDGYTNGGNQLINAERLKKEGEKEDPEYKAGAALAQDTLDNPANRASNKAKVDKATPIFKRGYYQGFNDGYTEQANAAIMKERNAFSEETLSSGPFSEIFTKGTELGVQGRLTPSSNELKTHFEPLFDKYAKENASKDANQSAEQKAQEAKKMRNDALAAFNIGMEKGFKGYYEEKQKPQNKSILFQKAYGIGQIIGYLTFKGGNAFLQQYKTALEDFFKAANLDLGAVAKSGALEQIKAFLIKKTLGNPVPSTIKKEGKDIPNPEYQEFTVGYNQGYDDGYKNDFVKSSDEGETSSDSHENEAYKQGYKDGQQVGRISAEVSSQVASPADKAAFDAEVQKLTAQAQAKGTDFYRGFNNGLNDGYLATLGGIEIETDASETANKDVQAIIAKYEKVGDSDMVGRIKKLYNESFKEISENIYSLLTKPLQAASNEEVKDVTDDDQFDTIPTEADFDKLEIQALGKKLGAQGEIANTYDAELDMLDTQLAATQEGNAEHKRLSALKSTIAEEIKDLSNVYTAAYTAAETEGKDKGYSYIQGYIAQMRLQGGEVPRITLGKIAKKSDKEYKKGKAAAESYGSAIRMNAMYDKSPNSKYISQDVRPKMPKKVVSQAYKEGYEEATMKWTLVEYTIMGLPIPDSITSNEIYKEYKGNTVVEVKQTQDSNQNKTLAEKAEMPERLSFGAGEKFAIPANAAQAVDIKDKKKAITTTDIEYYKARMMAEYYADIVEYANTFLADLKDADERADTIFSSKVSELESMKEAIQKAQPADLERIREELKGKIDKFLTAIPEKMRKSYEAEKNTIYTAKHIADLQKAYESFIKIASQNKKQREEAAHKKRSKRSKDGKDESMIEATTLELKNSKMDDIQKKMLALEAQTFANKKSKTYSKDKENPVRIALNNIAKIVPEFEDGYNNAINKVQGEGGAISQKMQVASNEYVTELGYAIGYIERLAALGIEKNQKQKALHIMQAFTAKSKAPITDAQRVAIAQMTLDKYHKAEDIAITYSDEFTKTLKNNKLFRVGVKKEEEKAKDKGASDAQLSFNLSSDNFIYIDNMQNQSKEGEEHIATVGPLGTLAAQYFSNLLPLVKQLIAFATLQKRGSEMQQKIKDMLSMPSIEAEKTYETFTKLLFNRKLSAGNKEASIDVNTKTLNFLYKNADTYKEDKLDNSIVLKNANKIFFNLKSQQLEIESDKEFIHLYGNTNEQLGIIGTGLKLSKDAKTSVINKPRFIIPSIQSKLIAKDEKDKEVRPSNQALLDRELTISAGKIDLSTDSITTALNKTKKAILDILNKEETQKTIK